MKWWSDHYLKFLNISHDYNITAAQRTLCQGCQIWSYLNGTNTSQNVMKSYFKKSPICPFCSLSDPHWGQIRHPWSMTHQIPASDRTGKLFLRDSSPCLWWLSSSSLGRPSSHQSDPHRCLNLQSWCSRSQTVPLRRMHKHGLKLCHIYKHVKINLHPELFSEIHPVSPDLISQYIWQKTYHKNWLLNMI